MDETNAKRQAEFKKRQKEKGLTPRKFWLTDDEYEQLKTSLKFYREMIEGAKKVRLPSDDL